MKPTIVVEFWGGPGSGKTTAAHQLFGELKNLHLEVEYLPEQIKRHAWMGKTLTRADILDAVSQQLIREVELIGHVDILVTDSPVEMSIVYNPELKIETFQNLREVFGNHKYRTQMPYYVPRTKKYLKQGRWQNEEEAKKIDDKVADLLQRYTYTRRDMNIFEAWSIKSIVQDIIAKQKTQSTGDTYV